MSKMGVQVVPRFSVFQTFDDEVATYQTLRFVGSTAMSAILPDMKAGPMPRSWSAESRPVVMAGGTGSSPDWAARGGGAVQTAASVKAMSLIRVLGGGVAGSGGAGPGSSTAPWQDAPGSEAPQSVGPVTTRGIAVCVDGLRASRPPSPRRPENVSAETSRPVSATGMIGWRPRLAGGQIRRWSVDSRSGPAHPPTHRYGVTQWCNGTTYSA